MHVAIIGGGVAGLALATTLSKTRNPPDITLIEPKDYVEVPWATIRALFSPETATTSTYPLSAWALKHNVTHIRASATALTSASITLDNGAILIFDVCVVAVGATNPAPSLARRAVETDIAARRARMAADGARFLSAGSVLVVGGGAVGAEFAGDIAAFASKEGKQVSVTLVLAGEHLLPEFSPAGGAKLKAKLEALGVRVVLNDRAVETDGVWTLARSGERIEAEEVVQSIGLRPCNGFLAAGGLGGSLDEKGWIKVDDHFRVEGARGMVFAVGDCCNALMSSGVNAMGNKSVVAHNVKLTLAALRDGKGLDGLDGSMKTKTPGPGVVVVTVGPDDGIAKTPLGTISFLLPALKNKTMFLFRSRSELGL